MTKRRHVTNEEFHAAYNGIIGDEQSEKAASDNRNIIFSVLKHYSQKLTPDELKSCGQIGLWKCLQYHDDSRGQKFTTSLFRFTRWECRQAIREKFGRRKERDDSFFLPIFERHLDTQCELPPDGKLEHIRECMEQLSLWEKKLIKAYYLEGKTIDQISGKPGCSLSKEATRQHIEKALVSLQEISRATLMAV